VKRIFSLKGRDSFREVFQQGKRFQHKGIQIIVLRKGINNHTTDDGGGSADDKDVLKMGISINRHFGEAHERNRAKRQIRAIWDAHSGDMKKGFHVIVRPDARFRTLSYNEKKNILQGLLQRAGVIANGKYS
jgi:ribonuclease P protein component